MPMQRRFPKKGFKNPFRTEIFAVNVGAIWTSASQSGTVDVAALHGAGHGAAQHRTTVKILGEGELTKKLVVKASAFSTSAKEKIEKAGGTAERRRSTPSAPQAPPPLVSQSMASGFQNIGKIPELRRRILFTLTLLAVYRIGAFVTTPGVNRGDHGEDREPGVGDVPGPVQHVLGRRARADVDLRARHHAVHQRVDHPAAADGRHPQAGADPEGRGDGAAAAQPVHALRLRRPVADPVVLHRALAGGQQPRLRAVRPGRHRSRLDASAC